MRISDWSSDVCSSDLLPALLARQLLGDQPLAAQRLRGLDLAPEAGIAQRRRSVGDEFAIDPGRGVDRRQFFNRYCREDLDADRPAPQLPLFKRLDLDRKSVLSVNSLSVRVYLGGRRIINNHIIFIFLLFLYSFFFYFFSHHSYFYS